MKLLMLVASLFSSLLINNNQEYNKFIDDLNSAYNEYALVEEYENNYYQLNVYAGYYNNDTYYAIYFRNIVPNEYKVKVVVGTTVYDLKTNARGDSIVVALDLGVVEEFSLEVFDKNGNAQYGLGDFKNLKVLSKEDISAIQTKVTGEGNGNFNPTKLRKALDFSLMGILFTIFGNVILLCVLIIFMYAKRKKGMFDKSIRTNSTFNFQEFVATATKENYEVEDIEPDYSFAVAEVEEVEEPETEFSKPLSAWQHYEEEKSDFNFEEHFKKLGFNPNYKGLSETEKNKIMLELMHLRGQNKITQDDYLDETSKLWKK